jgi:hypothetical protein
MYQVFAQMKHNLNFDAFYLIKYPDWYPKLITHGESWKKHVCRMFLASHFFLWENYWLTLNPFNHVVKNHICRVFLASHFFLWENDWVKINPFNDVVKNHSCMKLEKVLISSLWEIKMVQIIRLQMTWRTTSAWSVPLNQKKIPKCPLRQLKSRSYARAI